MRLDVLVFLVLLVLLIYYKAGGSVNFSAVKDKIPSSRFFVWLVGIALALWLIWWGYNWWNQYTPSTSEPQEITTPKPQTFGPWTIQELKEEGWTKWDKVVAPNGKLGQLVIIEPYHDTEFSTNPPNREVFFKNGGKFYLLDEDPGENKRDGLTPNRNFYFQSNTGQKEWVYIRTRPMRRF